MAKKRSGRKKGGRNRGYFYRKGRGWYATLDTRKIPLTDEAGKHIKDPDADAKLVREAHARFLLDHHKAIELRNDTTVLDVCLAYLRHAKIHGAAKTHKDRADTLFDFCFGLPPEFRNKDGSNTKRLTAVLRGEMKQKRLHGGYGQHAVRELSWTDIDRWISDHPGWRGGVRTRIQAVKRAFNFGVERKLIDTNPIRGYKVPRSRSRVTYISPEQEQACYEHANRALATAIQVCIRTGARFGSEFTQLTASHVQDHSDRMEWIFKPEESKTHRLRIIRIVDPQIIAIVRQQLKDNPMGPLFRNTAGTPWDRRVLSASFRNLKKRLAKKGVHLDADCCMYSCRHTYAKRTLQGYWSGKPTNIETLARLMGNTPQVCREHYLQWSEIDNELLWDVA